MYGRLITLQGKKSSMQKQQTCATMRSECPQKAATQKRKLKKKKKKKLGKLRWLMLVMKSKENVGPSLLYSRKRISSVCQTKANTLCTVSGRSCLEHVWRKQSTGAFGDKTESGSVGGVGEGGG